MRMTSRVRKLKEQVSGGKYMCSLPVRSLLSADDIEHGLDVSSVVSSPSGPSTRPELVQELENSSLNSEASLVRS